MKLLDYGERVGIVACSNGLDESSVVKMKELEVALNSLGLKAIFSDKIYKKFSDFNGIEKERAEVLINFFKDNNIKAIFDVSGGDLANGILDYLDFEIIKSNPKPFFGYSDLSVIINSIYSQANIKTFLYQIRNLVESYKDEQVKDFKRTFMEGGSELITFNYEWIQGSSMNGIVVGGNIRCLLKLSGTKFMPDFKDKIIFLESLSGDVPKMVTYLTQYKQMGVFDKVKGIILGSFTEMERKNYSPSISEIIKYIVNNPNMPIAKTNEVGHGKDSKCIIIGDNMRL
ncbi:MULTISPECIES: S66 peptidase family protein [unclassified Clostridium]|uniref:S66 family peptidase n=1 Tax=unclassified Clostridium TaxID=2614128 RepID=UPI0002984249|nr:MULTISPECIES: S66 peptidase family protein [unclassified Clostridium]EKQ51339.1 MAG: putative MccF-like protein (microcin C7 resistance) [Clostridium sp. Maddingley MBC34-26]